MGYDLRGSRVLITGGSGFVGSHIADQLADEGAREIVVIDNLVRGDRRHLRAVESRANGPTITFVQGDIADAALVDAQMAGVDYVYHQAALRITQCAEDPRAAFEGMYRGTFNVLESAIKAKVKKVVAASSASVYGEPSYLPIDEAHPYNNRTLYGAAKVSNEHLYRAFNEMYGLPYVALRYFNLYGSRMDTFGVYTEVMIRWMGRIEEGLPPIVFGDGLQSMDFVSVEDVARANILSMKSDASDVVLNVASGTQTTLNELAALLCEVMGRPDLTTEHREERKVNPVRHRLGSTELARDLIGFETTISLREGLTRLVAWWRAWTRENAEATQTATAGVRA